MSGAAILVIWTTVAVYGSTFVREKDWRPVGEFSSVAACTEAARQLNIDSKLFRCLPK